MSFCDCACHFRLGIWNFDPILLVGMPGIGGGERSGGGEAPPGASRRNNRDDTIVWHNHLHIIPQDNKKSTRIFVRFQFLVI